MNLFKTRFGAFSADGKEFVVTSPRTPRPWINVISNGDYGLTLSQTGSGYSWRTHAQVNRITRWEQDLVRDDWGKYIYLKDDQGHIWSAGWKPVHATPQSYRCRHGIGYSVIESMYFDIETELTVFVPVDEPLEVWKLTIRNRARKKRRIDVMTYLEWGLGRAPDWHREFHKTFMRTSYDPKLRAILANKSLWEIPTDKGHWNTDWPYTAFHSASVKPLSFETSKEAFLGMYGSVSNPAAVQKGRGGKNAGRGLDAVASLHIRLSLKPHESTVVVFTVGAADSSSKAGELISRYHDEASADDSLKSVVHRWENMLGATSVKTPDDAMNLMQNTWLKYQAISGRLWGRTAYYQTGGAYGFRDQLQDSQIWLPIDPDRTLNQIRLNARHQFKDGSVYHWWHPITEDGLHNKISDNLLWLPFVVANYLLEIGNDDGLDVEEPWVDDQNTSSLLEHCTRAIDLALQRMSSRGIPLIGAGDWNDGLSAVGLDMRGESIWLGQFLHKILRDFGTILERCGNPAKSAEYIAAAERLKQSINEFGWDGSWYWGATKDSGEKLGSKENQEGTIWLNPQIWGILGGVADAERANLIMDVVEQKLETAVGPLLLSPAYQTADRNIGYLTRYGPGMRENGGVYTHAATWAVIAAAQLGRGKTAFRIYSKLNPIIRGKDPLTYSAEPYVTAGNIDGPDSSFFGRGGWTWYSGSAAWLFRAGLDWILGVRPTWEGLVIDPCIPPDWKEFSVCRRFRGTVYNIHVSNPDGVETGVRELRVDGTVQCQGSGPRNKTIKPIMSDSVVEVEVVMGRNTGQ